MKVRGKSQQKSTHSWPLLGTFSVPGAFVIILPNPHNSMGLRCCHPHFMDVKTEGQRQRVTVSGLTSRFQLRSAWLPPLQGTPRPPGASPHSLCPPLPHLRSPLSCRPFFGSVWWGGASGSRIHPASTLGAVDCQLLAGRMAVEWCSCGQTGRGNVGFCLESCCWNGRAGVSVSHSQERG